MTTEIIEIDCRKFWRSGNPPEDVKKDLRRCSSVWLPVPKVPESPRLSMTWEWSWQPWVYTEGPCIPPQSKFDLSVEAYVDDELLATLKDATYEVMVEEMKTFSDGMDLLVFLLLHKKYTQGILLEEKRCGAELRKSVVLLGRQSEE